MEGNYNILNNNNNNHNNNNNNNSNNNNNNDKRDVIESQQLVPKREWPIWDVKKTNQLVPKGD